MSLKKVLLSSVPSVFVRKCSLATGLHVTGDSVHRGCMQQVCTQTFIFITQTCVSLCNRFAQKSTTIWNNCKKTCGGKWNLMWIIGMRWRWKGGLIYLGWTITLISSCGSFSICLSIDERRGTLFIQTWHLVWERLSVTLSDEFALFSNSFLKTYCWSMRLAPALCSSTS